MSGRRLSAGCLGLLGWALLVFLAVVWWAIDDPEFQEIHRQVSPAEPPPQSELRVYLGLGMGVPGVLSAWLGAYLWLADGRRRRRERQRLEAKSAWARESLDEAIDRWLNEHRRPSASEIEELHDRLDAPQRLYLARFVAGAGFHRFEEPAIPSEQATKDPGCGCWLAVFGAFAIGLFIAGWTVLSTVWIPAWARGQGLEIPMTPSQAFWGLPLGLGVASLPTGLAALLLVVGVGRYRDNRQCRQQVLERRRCRLKLTRQRLQTLRAAPPSALRGAFERGLQAAAEVELTAEQFQRLHTYSDEKRGSP